jgi:hypothetical protein
MSAAQTPLPDLLDRVPDDIVLGIPGDEPMFPSYTNIPIGKMAQEAAAELRRLHQFAEDQIGRATAAEAALQMTKATHALKLAAVEAQRDALLEALKLALSSHGVMLMSDPPREAWKVWGVEEKARAAIKAVEGEKT